ncbi:MAG: putative signal transduction protein [Bacillales bacterium]|nr:putative signal transduction protein [Bacillales bacterium]
MIEKEVLKVFDKLLVIEKMCKKMRFVDPVYKKILEYEGETFKEIEGSSCFQYLGKNVSCTNCISMRAINTNETHVKIEYNPDEVLILTAVPIELSNRRVVVELIVDATKSMVVNSVPDNKDDFCDIHSLIDKMNNLTSKDSLTGVYNRRYLNEKLPIDIVNTALTDENITIVMADIDFFKRVNDQYGHLAGDHILKSFAEILLSNTKEVGGWVSRYGGEEFLIIIPRTGLKNAIKIAENIRREVESTEFIYKENNIRITSSFGVISLKPTNGLTVDILIEDVDRKLYLAKKNGRNRTEY